MLAPVLVLTDDGVGHKFGGRRRVIVTLAMVFLGTRLSMVQPGVLGGGCIETWFHSSLGGGNVSPWEQRRKVERGTGDSGVVSRLSATFGKVCNLIEITVRGLADVGNDVCGATM